MAHRHYNPHQNVLDAPKPVKYESEGCWPCDVDSENGEDFNFLEAHRGFTWDKEDPSNRKVVFRVSRNIKRFKDKLYPMHEVRLGDCVILGLDKVRELRDRLNEMLEECEEGA